MNGGLWCTNTPELNKGSEIMTFVWKYIEMEVTVNQSRKMQKGNKAQFFLGRT